MSFTITNVEVQGFRSYPTFRLELDPGLTVIVGPNAVGKTNLVEAIQLLTEGTSFRNPSWREVISWGEERARLSLEAEEGERRRDVLLEIDSAGRRMYTVNGKRKKTHSEIAGEIPCVIFTPDDLSIVKESAERRRDALDEVGVQLSATYARLKREYERVLRQRNKLLRSELSGPDSLDVWDERLVSLGSRLTMHRTGLFKMVEAYTTAAYSEIAQDGILRARYLPSWERDGIEGSVEDGAASMERHLLLKRNEEISRGTTLVGPHRDEIVFEIDGRNSRVFASQGQQRSIALSFKMAEVKVVAKVSGRRPLLLLDDVMSELDESRRTALAGMVGDSAQTIMTTTNLGYFTGELLDEAKVVTL